MGLSNQGMHESDERRKRRRERQFLRVFLLLIAVFLVTASPHQSRLPVLVPALSPLTTLASWLTTRTLLVTSWIGLSVALIVLARRRWFCRWVCPTGTCADGASSIGMRVGRRCPRAPAIGSWIMLLTIGGALLGLPWLLWLDPLALFSGVFGLFDTQTIPSPRWAAAGMGIVLVVSFIWPGIWCSYLCPLGAFQDWTYRAAQLPLQLGNRLSAAFVKSKVVQNAGWSQSLLPVAESADTRAATESRPGLRLSRRGVFGLGLGSVAALTTRRLWASKPSCLRPPGAVREERFVHLCIRCGNCLRSCPTNVIRPDYGNSGILGLLSPTLQFDEDYCQEGCTQCTLVCPSGALKPILSSATKAQAVIGFPQVNMDLCLLGDDRECSKCRNWCPYEAITLRFSEEEYTLVPEIDQARCPGCGACQAACPTLPDKAITVEPLATLPG